MKNLLFVLAVFITVSSFGQKATSKRHNTPTYDSISKYKLSSKKQKATIYFRDGTTQTGISKIKGWKIKFKKDKKSEFIKYNHTTVNKIIIHLSYKNIEYQYKIDKTNGIPKYPLLELIVKGEKISLYYQETTTTAPMGMNTTLTYSNTFSHYYTSKINSEDTVYSVFVYPGLKNFKKTVSKYFKDCPKLVEKIKAKEFKKEDMVDIVKFYNNNCGEKTEQENKTDEDNSKTDFSNQLNIRKIE